MKTSYYIITPKGRQKIKPNPSSDEEATQIFKDHWTATASWAVVGSRRVLVKETREEILIEEL